LLSFALHILTQTSLTAKLVEDYCHAQKIVYVRFQPPIPATLSGLNNSAPKDLEELSKIGKAFVAEHPHLFDPFLNELKLVD